MSKKLNREQAMEMLDLIRLISISTAEAKDKLMIEFMLKNEIKCCSQCGLIQEEER